MSQRKGRLILRYSVVSNAPAGGDRISREYLLHLNPTLVPKSGKLTQPPALPFHASLSGTSITPIYCTPGLTAWPRSLFYVYHRPDSKLLLYPLGTLRYLILVRLSLKPSLILPPQD